MKGDPVIREYQAGPGDREAFRRLNEEWLNRYFVIEDKDRKLFADPEGQILTPGGHIYFVDVAGQCVGCCALLRVDDRTFELAKMAVTPAHQGRGHSKLLMRTCIERARSAGAKRLYLESNSKLQTALALYRSFGFTDVAKDRATPSEYARVDVWMELVL